MLEPGVWIEAAARAPETGCRAAGQRHLHKIRAMDERDRLRERVASFPRWHYEFDLGGVRTPISDPEHVNRHIQRRNYFFPSLIRLAGGSLAGKRVLDLGCNAGFWSLAAIEAGADFVLGVDGRQMHIDQANLVFDVKRVESTRYRFELADVFELELGQEPFDIVLCLGLLYHVSRPFELMERIARWNDDLLVIDTTLDTRAGSYFRLHQQDVDDPRHAVDRPVALVPTGPAVVSLVEQFGYRAVALRPRFTDWTGAMGYRKGQRRAFVCAKRTPLDDLDTEAVGASVGATSFSASAQRGSGALGRRMRRSLRFARSRLGALRNDQP